MRKSLTGSLALLISFALFIFSWFRIASLSYGDYVGFLSLVSVFLTLSFIVYAGVAELADRRSVQSVKWFGIAGGISLLILVVVLEAFGIWSMLSASGEGAMFGYIWIICSPLAALLIAFVFGFLLPLLTARAEPLHVRNVGAVLVLIGLFALLFAVSSYFTCNLGTSHKCIGMKAANDISFCSQYGDTAKACSCYENARYMGYDQDIEPCLRMEELGCQGTRLCFLRMGEIQDDSSICDYLNESLKPGCESDVYWENHPEMRGHDVWGSCMGDYENCTAGCQFINDETGPVTQEECYAGVLPWEIDKQMKTG